MARLIGFAALGALALAIGGYLLGVVAGLGLTWYNNHLLSDTAPQGSYLFWAHFMGQLFAFFSWPVGIVCGLLYGLRRKGPDAV
ncbi:MAG: hypothetical protein H0T45_01145 [Pyrinomonadaceae bacterium]|nr:hypothetical protein [Pyrinomonadaceae bacterium]MDQ3134133.1 hypothetical protein [Acidobacteriota bacterium]